MRKLIIGVLYFLFFWVVLPYLILNVSARLDSTLHLEMQPWLLGGIFITAFSLFFLILSLRNYIRSSGELPVSAYPPGALIRRGLYKYWRHPIYLFYILAFMGIGFFMGSISMHLIVLPVLILLAYIYIRVEENILLNRFGDAYRFHQQRTGLIFPPLYFVIRVLVFLVCKFLFKMQVTNKTRIPDSGSFFVVAAHKNYLDPFFIGSAIPQVISYISTFEMFRSPVMKWVMNKTFSIPRKRYKKDVRAIRAMSEALRNGTAVGIFPEGERSWTGETQSFKPEVLKLILKYSHIPVLPVVMNGQYLIWPRWSDKYRKFPLNIDIREPYYPDPSMSIEDLELELLKRLTPEDNTEETYSEKTFPRNNVEHKTDRIKYLSGRANHIQVPSEHMIDGIDKVIYRCINCRSLHSFDIVGPALHCHKCGYKVQVSNDFNLILQGGKIMTVPEYYQATKAGSEDLICTNTSSEFGQGMHIQLEDENTAPPVFARDLYSKNDPESSVKDNDKNTDREKEHKSSVLAQKNDTVLKKEIRSTASIYQKFTNSRICTCSVSREKNDLFELLMKGNLCIQNESLQVDDGQQSVKIPLHHIQSVTTESNNKLHVYDGVEDQLYLFQFPAASVLLWQDILVSVILKRFGKRVNRS